MTKRDPDPQCEHRLNGTGGLDVIVTNQPGRYDSTRSHRSTWVCVRPECVLDAMAWVRRGTDENPWWRIGVDGEWHDGMYEPTGKDTD